MAKDPGIGIDFRFIDEDLDQFTVLSFEGEEAISQTFRFTLDLVSHNGEVDFDSVLGEGGSLTISLGETSRTIHGVVTSIEQGDHIGDYYRYRVVLEPRLALMRLSRQNQIYGTVETRSILDIVELEFREDADKDATDQNRAPIDYKIRVAHEDAYPKRDYIVQYQETDLNFIQRLLEKNGVFYFFEHDEEKEIVVIADANMAFPKIDAKTIRYRPATGMAGTRGTIRKITAKAVVQPKEIVLRDHNYRLPNVGLSASERIDPNGHGVINDYGDHFWTPEEGQELAEIRAQEIRCQAFRLEGMSDHPQIQAGRMFDLEHHFRGDFNRTYIVTKVYHRGQQSIAGISEHLTDAERQNDYRNEFSVIPSTETYRPPRLTPRPVVNGVMSAHIDAEGSGERAEIDEYGRYKIAIPFDVSGAPVGKASSHVRMVQPYGGPKSGMQFPLLKGTEVMWGCVGGNPDRPIILGAVPNPKYRAVANNQLNDRNRIRTPSGIMMEFTDGLAPEDQPASSQTEQQQGQSPFSGGSENGTSMPASATSGRPHLDLPSQRQFDKSTGEPTSKGSKSTEGSSWRIRVPGYDGKGGTTPLSYHRLGKVSGNTDAEIFKRGDEIVGGTLPKEWVREDNDAAKAVAERLKKEKNEPARLTEEKNERLAQIENDRKEYAEYARQRNFKHNDGAKRFDKMRDEVIADYDKRIAEAKDRVPVSISTTQPTLADANKSQGILTYDTKERYDIAGSHRRELVGGRRQLHVALNSQETIGNPKDRNAEVSVDSITFDEKKFTEFRTVNGNRGENVFGDSHRYVGGDGKLFYDGDLDRTVQGKLKEEVRGKAGKTYFGPYEVQNKGFSRTISFARSESISFSLKAEIALSMSIALKIGLSAELSFGVKLDSGISGKIEIAATYKVGLMTVTVEKKGIEVKEKTVSAALTQTKGEIKTLWGKVVGTTDATV